VKTTFTSESVTEGHPDKMADQISDTILDAMLEGDAASRVACETLLTTGLVVVAGEVTTSTYVDIATLVRDTVCGIGYDDDEYGFNGKTCGVLVSLDAQSPDIAQGVDAAFELRSGKGGEDLLNAQGAGDQGMMFGFACDETRTFMPLPIFLAHRLVEEHARLRRGEMPFLRPDAKSQVTVEYNADGTPHRIHTIVLSTQHDESVVEQRAGKDYFKDEARQLLVEKLILPTLRKERPDLIDGKGQMELVLPGQPPRREGGEVILCHINPTGCFLQGGPHGDCGLTGRKIIVDTYGGRGRHGGGAFSGKDPTKVDRSAAYMARYIAKNVVAAGLASQCEVQLSYAIGYPEPINVWVSTFGTTHHGLTDHQIADLIRKHFKLTPRGIIESLDLRRPIYRETARHGHFGRELPGFTWEKTDKAAALKSEVTRAA